MKKLKVRFEPFSDGWHDNYDCIQYMHITCLLYKLGVIEQPVMLGRCNEQLITKMAQDMLDGHIHIFENPNRRYR